MTAGGGAITGRTTGERPVAMVTGGARRVGRAIALGLAAAGCDVVATWRSSEDEARGLAEEVAGVDARAAIRLERLDLDDLAATERLGAELAASLPRLDYLVHNASIYQPSKLAELRAADILSHYRVNAAGPLLLTARLADLLRRSAEGGGARRADDDPRAAAGRAGPAVVCMCDIHAIGGIEGGRPRKDFAAYSMSKAALVEMVQTLARELAPQVRVNGVAPGVVAWPASGPDSDAEAQRRYLSRVPLARSGTPEDAAEVVRWLAMEAAYVTGVIVPLDGGRRLA